MKAMSENILNLTGKSTDKDNKQERNIYTHTLSVVNEARITPLSVSHNEIVFTAHQHDSAGKWSNTQ